MARNSIGNEAMAARATATPATEPGRMRRRGLVAGAAALATGLLAKEALPVVAANGGNVILGGPNYASFQTTVAALNTFSSANGSAVFGADGTPAPTTGGQSIIGLVGLGGGNGGSGVVGVAQGAAIQTADFNAAGVVGRGGNSAGVYGTSISGRGMYGSSTYGIGVQGFSGGGAGIFGESGTGTGSGVYGYSSNGGSGVSGNSTIGVGVLGVSGGGSSAGAQPYGVVGSVTSAPGFALFGVTSVAGTVGFAGGAAVAGASAGQFSGPVNIYNSVPGAEGNLYVQNNFQVSGTKSAAVPHPDGTHRLLYCVESPEAWFEDFGEGTITAGKAEVKLDPDFAAVVDTSKLHVFFTGHDTHHALTLAGRTATGFSVAAVPSTVAVAAGKVASDLSGTFTYRVVAKRKDVVAERLAKFTVPGEIKAPALVIPPAPPATKKG